MSIFGCDKCGRDVPLENDATTLDALITGNPVLVHAGPRHLLPVIENGQRVCEGSPSRAQYLEGQPRDTRQAYSYRPETEAAHRAAYAQMLEMAEPVEIN